MVKRQPSEQTHGGLAFYLSLTVQILLLLVIFPPTIKLFFSSGILYGVGFIITAILGIISAPYIMRGKLYVFLHEWKHSFVSSLAGNRAKGMKVDHETGHFEFEYTKKTAHNNAFIALAPYFLPVFMPIALALVCLFLKDYPYLQRLLVGFAFGIDCFCNWYDVSPVQTDLTMVSGGFMIGVLFVVISNALILTLLMTWVVSDWEGYREVGATLLSFSKALFIGK